MAENKSLLARIFSQTAPEAGTVRYPLMGIIFGPYTAFIDHFRAFFLIAGIYALIMTVVYLAGGQSMFCSFGNAEMPDICSMNPWLYIGVRVVILLVTTAFCVRYYQAVWLQRNISWRFLLVPQKTAFYSFAAFIVFILLNAAAGLSWHLLSVREPNPDWRIELVYFGIAGLGFVVPFILLRFYSVLADIWGGTKIPSPFKIWQMSRGNGLRLILGITLWFFVFVFLLSAVQTKFSLADGENSLYIIIIGEYVFNFAVLLLMSFFINYCGLQKYFLTERNADEKPEIN